MRNAEEIVVGYVALAGGFDGEGRPIDARDLYAHAVEHWKREGALPALTPTRRQYIALHAARVAEGR